jgi:membrane protease YdiL (CAAX protease family)
MTKYDMHPRPKIANFFLSVEEPRLRAGWRLLAHTILTFFFLMLFGTILAFGLVFVGSSFEAIVEEASPLLDGLLSLPTITIATLVARKVIDRRSFTSLGFEINKATLKDLLVGVFISMIMMAFIFLLEYGLGWLEVETFVWVEEPIQSWISPLAGGFAFFIVVGFQEELLSRGYHLQNLVDGLNLPAGVVISSVIFALLHSGNPFASPLSIVLLIFAGIFLAFGWVRTGALWLPIGLHIGWNFFQGNVFGFPVSGVLTQRMIRHTVIGPEAITGGNFGPEAGLIIVPAIALGALLLWGYTEYWRHPKTETVPSSK